MAETVLVYRQNWTCPLSEFKSESILTSAVYVQLCPNQTRGWTCGSNPVPDHAVATPLESINWVVVRMIGGLVQAFTMSTKPESGTCEEASCSKKEERGLPEMQEGTCQVHDDTLPESRMGMRGGLGGRRGWSSTPAKLGWRDGTCLLMYVLELMFNRLTMVT